MLKTPEKRLASIEGILEVGRLLSTAGRLTSALRVLILGALLASAWVVFGAASVHALGLADSISETVEEATQAPVPASATESAPPVSSEVSSVPESAGAGLVSAVTAPVSTATSQVAAPIESITQPVIAPVEAAAAPLTNTATDVAPVTNTVTDVVAPVTNTVTDVVAPVTNTVTDVVTPVTNTVTDVVAPVANTVTPVINTVTDVASPAPSMSVTEPVDAGTAGVSKIIGPAPVEVPATQTLLGGGASTGISAIAAISPVQIFDPVFAAVPAPDTQNRSLVADGTSVENAPTSASAGSADPAGNPVQPSPQGQASSGSSGSGSVLRGGGDTGFAGVAILNSSQFSADLSGSDAVFARSADMPGPIASEHGFSPD